MLSLVLVVLFVILLGGGKAFYLIVWFVAYIVVVLARVSIWVLLPCEPSELLKAKLQKVTLGSVSKQ